jgi:hypothetical protein
MKKKLFTLICLLVALHIKAQINFSSASYYGVGQQPLSVTSADFNNDGKLDLAVANNFPMSVSVLIGTGTGSFSTASNYSSLASNAFSIISKDFNSDGNADLAVANFASDDVSIFLGTGTGSFITAVKYPAGDAPWSITSADFNSDGKVDLAVANSNSNSVSVLMGTGTGSFSPAVNFGVGTNPRSVIAVDFNGDGKYDIGTANYGSSSISKLIGTGTGSFMAAINYAVGANPHSLTSADFNGDAMLDVATVHYNSSSLSVLMGTSTGSFVINASYAIGANPNTVTTADFNGDGKSDLLTANWGSNTVSVLKGIGTGSFSPALNFGVNVSPNEATTGDFNGDGKTDIATANYGTNNASVLLNVTPPIAESLNFDGVNDHIDISNSLSLQIDTGTIEAWIKIPGSGAGTGLRGIIVKENAYGLFLKDNVLCTYDWSTATTNTVGILLNDNNWHHVALSFKSGIANGCQFYIDGIETGLPFTYSINSQASQLTIGTNNANAHQLKGSIDEARIWNMLRTQCEINTYKNCEIINPTTGLVANYHFNQGFNAGMNPGETILYDASGSTGTGTLTGFALVTNTISNWVSPGGVVSGYTAILPPPLVGTTLTNSVICSGDYTILSGTGANSYIWSDGIANAVSFTPTVTTTYTVTGTNTLTGCSNTAVNTVTVNALPTISVTSGAICSGQSFTMIPVGASTYTFSSGTDVVMPVTDVSYSVTGTSSLGCLSSNVAVSSITVNPAPTIAVTSGAICSGQSFTMIPSGASTYTFSNGTDIVTPSTDMSYSVTGTSSLGCLSSNIAVSSITVNALPSINATTNNTLLCVGQTATLTASGSATSYTWSTNSSATSIAVSPTTTTVYTITGTDVMGCSNSTSIQQNVSLCTFISHLTGNESVSSIYPNPTTGIFTVELNFATLVIITNIFDQIVYSENLEVGKHSIELEKFPAGAYFVKAIKNDKCHTIKLIKE